MPRILEHSLAKSLKEAMFAWELTEPTTIQAASLHERPNFGHAGSVDRRMMAPSPLVTEKQSLFTKNVSSNRISSKHIL